MSRPPRSREELSRAILRRRVEQLRKSAPARNDEAPPIARVSREGRLALSFEQKRLWFLARLGAGSAGE